MKYQRVLYTKKFTSELKTKLRIVSYEKRRSLKGNVYYVSFASDSDIKFADRACKRLQNVTLKPFQPRSCAQARCEHQFSPCKNDTRPSSLSSSPISFRSPPTTLTFLSDSSSSFTTSPSDFSRRTNETLEVRAMRILSSCIETDKSDKKLAIF